MVHLYFCMCILSCWPYFLCGIHWSPHSCSSSSVYFPGCVTPGPQPCGPGQNPEPRSTFPNPPAEHNNSNSNTRTAQSFADWGASWLPHWFPHHPQHPAIPVGTHSLNRFRPVQVVDAIHLLYWWPRRDTSWHFAHSLRSFPGEVVLLSIFSRWVTQGSQPYPRSFDSRLRLVHCTLTQHSGVGTETHTITP